MLKLYESMQKEIDKRQSPGTLPRKLEDYTGDYYDSAGIFYIKVTPKTGSTNTLRLAFQGQDKHAFDLRHQHHDVFEWALSRNETAKRSRYYQFEPTYFKMTFEANGWGSRVWLGDTTQCSRSLNILLKSEGMGGGDQKRAERAWCLPFTYVLLLLVSSIFRFRSFQRREALQVSHLSTPVHC